MSRKHKKKRSGSINPKCGEFIANWAAIVQDAAKCGVSVRYNVCKAGCNDFLHVMVDDATGMRLINWYPSNGTWYRPNDGAKGKTNSVYEVFRLSGAQVESLKGVGTTQKKQPTLSKWKEHSELGINEVNVKTQQQLDNEMIDAIYGPISMAKRI